VANNKKLDLSIRFKRFEKDQDEAREFRADYFSTLLPQALIDYAWFTFERIFQESELPWLIDPINWWKRHRVERRKWQRRYIKSLKESQRDYEKREKARELEELTQDTRSGIYRIT